jgi:REP element-mobilizing transposase RayT
MPLLSTPQPVGETRIPAPPGTWYFLTLITQGRDPLFGRVQGGKLAVTPMGLEIARMWKYCAALRRDLHLGPWMVMPDHFHALVRVQERNPTLEPAPRTTRLFAPPRIRGPLGSLVAAFKMGSTREINRLRETPRRRLWRKGVLYRTVGETDLDATARYILDNPRTWLATHAG